MPTNGEEGSEPELVRSDDFLANPSDPRSIPSAASSPEVLVARNRMHALGIKLRLAIRRAFTQRHPAPLVFEDDVTEDNIADGFANPIPTIDANPLIIRRPHQGIEDNAANDQGDTTFWFGVKVLESLEVMVGFITSRAYLIRAFVFLVVVSAALGTVALLSLLIPDVPDPVLAVSLWGFLVLLVGGPVFGIGLWFVDKRHDQSGDRRERNRRDHR
ncbi:hypothetical protein ACWEOZ_22990 [Actinoplanes sp. NPDC004185]